MERGVVFAIAKRYFDLRWGLCALSLVVGLAWIHTNAPIPEQRVMPFAKPQLGQHAYNVEVAHLGARISSAFGIKPVPVSHFVQKGKAVFTDAEHFDPSGCLGQAFTQG